MVNDNLEESDGVTTKKIDVITKENELEYAQRQYDEAVQKMLLIPTLDNVKAFELANKKLFEIQDAYRLGAKLLLMRTKYIADTINIVRRAVSSKGSQKSHIL